MCGLDLLTTFNRLQIETAPFFRFPIRPRRLILGRLRLWSFHSEGCRQRKDTCIWRPKLEHTRPNTHAAINVLESGEQFNPLLILKPPHHISQLAPALFELPSSGEPFWSFVSTFPCRLYKVRLLEPLLTPSTPCYLANFQAR